jgi:hypothetical protein
MPSRQKEVSMHRIRVFALAALGLLTLSWATAEAGVFIGVGIPGPYYRPHPRYYYGPRIVIAAPPVVVAAPVVAAPVVVAAPAPVVVQPAPVVVQPAPVATTLPAAPVPVSNH